MLSGAPSFPDLYERLPVALLAVLPAALIVLSVIRVRSLAIDLRARRYGSRLRLRLSGLFLLAVLAASLPQGLFLLRLAYAAQASSSSSELREALSEGQAWPSPGTTKSSAGSSAPPRAWPEEYSRDAQAVASDPLGLAGPRSPHGVPRALRGRQKPRLRGARGREASPRRRRRPAPGSGGHLLAALSSGGTNLVRYAVPLGGTGKRQGLRRP